MKKLIKLNPDVSLYAVTTDDYDRVCYVKLGSRIIMLFRIVLEHAKADAGNIQLFQVDPVTNAPSPLLHERINFDGIEDTFLIQVSWDQNGPIHPCNKVLVIVDGGLAVFDAISIPKTIPDANTIRHINELTRGYASQLRSKDD